MKLNIPPCEMGKMFFYDIMLLYNRYEAYVKDEHEAQQKQEAEYRDQYGEPSSQYSNISQQVSQMSQKMGSITPSKITSGFNFPNL